MRLSVAWSWRGIVSLSGGAGISNYVQSTPLFPVCEMVFAGGGDGGGPVVHGQALLAGELGGCFFRRAAGEDEESALQAEIEVLAVGFEAGAEAVGLDENDRAASIQRGSRNGLFPRRNEWRNENGTLFYPLEEKAALGFELLLGNAPRYLQSLDLRLVEKEQVSIARPGFILRKPCMTKVVNAGEQVGMGLPEAIAAGIVAKVMCVGLEYAATPDAQVVIAGLPYGQRGIGMFLPKRTGDLRFERPQRYTHTLRHVRRHPHDPV